MRVPNTVHASRPWRIHELTRDFRLEDVWALPTRGGAEDFPRLVQLRASFNRRQSSSRAVRVLSAIRRKLGERLGWDAPGGGLGVRVPPLRARLPADLRDAASAPHLDAGSFSWLYVTDDECATEFANQTVHGVAHFGWVADEAGGYYGEMAVYVKPNGALGSLYMATIRPFRRLIVYPKAMRDIERAWRAQITNDAPARAAPS
jgi:hypothetical protein